MSEDQCSNCYWWDATVWSVNYPGARMCHRPGVTDHTITTADHSCKYHRPIKPDDPATTWNRKQPGRKTKSPRAPKDPAAVKRGRNSKRKGKKGEKEWGEYVVERMGGEYIARGGDRDVQFIGNALAPVQHEVKRRKSFSMLAHCRQARTDGLRHGLQRWLVAFRADCKPGERKHWHVVLDADDYLTDMQELHERRSKDVGEE